MAARAQHATPDRNGRMVLAAMVLLGVVAFVWLVATLAAAAFG